uniref:E3 ubiquitin-protein ligase RNF31-like n=1 Tax=Sinocyclocheilus anshuiensis TaxID=1608454 RepID=A0A671PWH3_9TELE
MASLSDQLEEVRVNAEGSLSTPGSAQEMRAGVAAMANIPLPPSSKYCYIAAESMLTENSNGNNRREVRKLSTALNILEKYGSNLTNPNRPKYWRTVKYNNPVFRTTVDSIQGGRAVLNLYGYTNQQQDGLSFPDDVVQPDVGKVASVTLEVMCLRMELDIIYLILSVRFYHFHSIPLNCSAENCTICGIFPVSAHCPTCTQRLCIECDRLYHSHSGRSTHIRIPVTSSKATKRLRLALSSLSAWQCSYCTTVNTVQQVLCENCDRPRLSSAAPSLQEEPSQPSTISEWQCKSCTVVNAGSSILCEVCERPRLATRPPVAPSRPTPSTAGLMDSQWVCQFCTYVNHTPSPVCEMCCLSRSEPALSPPKPLPLSSVKDVTPPPAPPKVIPTEDPDFKRQRLMREEGLKLIQIIRAGEKKGVSPEEVYTSMCVSGNSNVMPYDWLKAELPHVLDEILPLSRAEAKRAWLAAGGDNEKAVRQALRDRRVKVKELGSLGFNDVTRCEEALRQSGGDVRGALALLQRPLLEQFHQRMWSDEPEPPIDINHPDKQHVCRRLLAVFDLPSWGRCELVLSLLRDTTATYTLEDVIQAVRESPDRDFIRRVLNKECPICLSVFPHSKVLCCSVCCGCFKQHFTIAVRDKHIRDMVCPVCTEPDINNPEHLNSYFSTLDIQLRDCLEPDVYDLFHKKLTEQALIKDPKFLWCSHCSYGFIYDGDQLKVTCMQCRKSFCAQCKKPWEPQHMGLSCEQFQLWKRENDPEYQRQGLAGYLRDNGITCPNCRFQYALARGGCMHFNCSQCRYQFCSGCNNPFHTVSSCLVLLSSDCLSLFHALFHFSVLKISFSKTLPFPQMHPCCGVFVSGVCGVIEQKDEGPRPTDSPCGAQTQPAQAGLCEKHYREYLVSLINGHSIDPAHLYTLDELTVACRRYHVDVRQGDGEDERAYFARLLKKLMDDVPLGDKVPRKK